MSKARAAYRPELGEMIATARVSFARVSARKARLVADVIRGLTVAEASQQLANLHRPSAVPYVDRLIKSAVANAKEQEATETDGLIVGEIFVDGGPMLKRFRPRAMGRACTIRKRMSHMTVKLFKNA